MCQAAPLPSLVYKHALLQLSQTGYPALLARLNRYPCKPESGQCLQRISERLLSAGGKQHSLLRVFTATLPSALVLAFTVLVPRAYIERLVIALNALKACKCYGSLAVRKFTCKRASNFCMHARACKGASAAAASDESSNYGTISSNLGTKDPSRVSGRLVKSFTCSAASSCTIVACCSTSLQPAGCPVSTHRKLAGIQCCWRPCPVGSRWTA